MGIEYLLGFWPVLAVLGGGIVVYGILVFFTGRRSTFTTAIYFAANMMFASLAYSVLDSSGMSGLLTTEHTDESEAALTELCENSCERNQQIVQYCPQYCVCVMKRGRHRFDYPELIALMTGRGEESNIRVWNQTARNCAFRVMEGDR
jgi:hypothetical protein